ncbi:MAG: hypothetical protein HKP48_09225 [Winogradskyella sp.]|uniref:type II secretion system protein GspG n=1 Tax=Winogradskyella sp. TaxID=1883156 RepID=UPI0018479548|nr:type II secretion system protein GspG [Winogradskyella sp.]MBT8244166.1 type II secretion system protein GspG [Winogradskyella sp.]NNK23451.1 hypothetical protein [Winogradskyella sp.]
MKILEFFLEILVWFGLDFSDFKHQRKIEKLEKADGKSRTFQKYFLGPSAKTIFKVFIILIILFFGYLWYSNNYSKPKKTKKEIIEISEYITQWKSEYNSLPITIEIMIKSKPLHKKWLTDEWKRPYFYSIDSTDNSFELFSAGKDGKFETKDDISSK